MAAHTFDLPSQSEENVKTVHDIEKLDSLSRHLTNTRVSSFSWSNVEVTVKDRKTKQPVQILAPNSGLVRAGNVLALMGPSGSGKTVSSSPSISPFDVSTKFL
jgi:ABC-type glutathione transport system ATPase component